MESLLRFYVFVLSRVVSMDCVFAAFFATFCLQFFFRVCSSLLQDSGTHSEVTIDYLEVWMVCAPWHIHIAGVAQRE